MQHHAAHSPSANGTGSRAPGPAILAPMRLDDTPENPARPLSAADALSSTSPSSDESPPGRAPRHDGWTLDKQRRFCEVLASCGVVEQAADAVGMSARSAYAFRNRSDGHAFAAVWDEARDVACRALIDEAVELAFEGRVVQVIENGEITTERRRNSPARLLRTVERLRREEVLGDALIVAASRDFEHCLDLLEAGEAYPEPPAAQAHDGLSSGMIDLIRRHVFMDEPLPEGGARVGGGGGGDCAGVDCDAASSTRHAELVSASMHHFQPSVQAEPWTLKQVQGDDSGEGGEGGARAGNGNGADGGEEDVAPNTPRRPHRWTPEVQRAFCEALAKCGSVDKACRAIGKGRASAYALRNRAEGRAFAIAWDAALLVVSDEMMDMALELAREGSTDRLYRGGKLVRVRRTVNADVMLDTVARVQAMRLPDRRGFGTSDFGASLDRLESGEALAAMAAGDDAPVLTLAMVDAMRRGILGDEFCDFDCGDGEA